MTSDTQAKAGQGQCFWFQRKLVSTEIHLCVACWSHRGEVVPTSMPSDMGNRGLVHQLQALPFSQLLPPAQRCLGAIRLLLLRRGRQGLERSCLLLRACACASTQVSRLLTLGEILKLPAGHYSETQMHCPCSQAPPSRQRCSRMTQQ